MTFFYQMGLMYASYQNIAPQYQLMVSNTTLVGNTTIYHYTSLPVVNTTAMTGYKQSAMNGIAQVWFDWAMVLGFITVIYILIEILVYRIIGETFGAGTCIDESSTLVVMLVSFSMFHPSFVFPSNA